MTFIWRSTPCLNMPEPVSCQCQHCILFKYLISMIFIEIVENLGGLDSTTFNFTSPNLISFFLSKLKLPVCYLLYVSISSLNLNWDIKCNLIYPLKFIFNCWVIYNMYVARIQFLPASCQMQTLHWNSAHDDTQPT